jgi:Mor family transcriptional regulator
MADLRDREVYESIIRFSEDVLKAGGMPAEQAANYGMEVADLIRKDWGGQKIYFSKAAELERDPRDMDIYKRFHGRREEASLLAKEHGVSEERIRQIVAKMTAAERARRQGGLFPA